LSGFWQHDQAEGVCTMSLPSRRNYSDNSSSSESWENEDY
jgi:hypothetical protein